MGCISAAACSSNRCNGNANSNNVGNRTTMETTKRMEIEGGRFVVAAWTTTSSVWDRWPADLRGVYGAGWQGRWGGHGGRLTGAVGLMGLRCGRRKLEIVRSIQSSAQVCNWEVVLRTLFGRHGKLRLLLWGKVTLEAHVKRGYGKATLRRGSIERASACVRRGSLGGSCEARICKATLRWGSEDPLKVPVRQGSVEHACETMIRWMLLWGKDSFADPLRRGSDRSYVGARIFWGSCMWGNQAVEVALRHRYYVGALLRLCSRIHKHPLKPNGGIKLTEPLNLSVKKNWYS